MPLVHGKLRFPQNHSLSYNMHGHPLRAFWYINFVRMNPFVWDCILRCRGFAGMNAQFRIHCYLFPKPMRMCGKRLERRPKPWIKKTFGSSSQNRYTSRFVRRRRHRLTDLVHFRFVQPFWLVVHFTDLCNSKKSWTWQATEKITTAKKGPGKPPKIPNKNINTSTGQLASKNVGNHWGRHHLKSRPEKQGKTKIRESQVNTTQP